MIGGGGGPKSYTMKLQGGQNVRIFFYPKIERIVRIFFQIVRIVRIFILEMHRFFFNYFSNFFMKISKKKFWSKWS